jgi:DinB superfamily
MNRAEIEIKLNQERAWTLETWAALPPNDLSRGITTSRHDPEASWCAKDHLVHLAGIEAAFNGIIRRHLAGDPNPIGIMTNPDGSAASREELMTRVHALNEAWVHKHRDKSFNEVVALGQKIRGETLSLLAELTDEQLQERLPGAPWADGTIGAVIAINGDHARQHHGWVTRGLSQEQ